MKYYHYLLFSILLLFLQNCKEKDNVLKYDLEILQATIKLPNTYRLVNKERLDRILYKTEDAGFKDELLAVIQRKKNVKMLIDTLSPYRFILFTEKVAYLKIDTVSMYALIDMERKKSSSKEGVNDSAYFVGARLDSIAGFKFIEFKHKRKSGNRQRIGYTFTLSDNTHTSGISFFGPEEQDARKYIKTILKK